TCDALRADARALERALDPGAVVALQVHLAVDDAPAGGEAVLQGARRLLEVDARREARDDRRGLVVPAGGGAHPDPGRLPVEGAQDLVELVVPHRCGSTPGDLPRGRPA